MINKLCIAVALLLLSVSINFAQSETGKTPNMPEKKKVDYSADHKSIDSIMKATYDVISGPKGKKRDWVRFEALFHPDARLIPTGINKEGVHTARASTPAKYRELSEPFFDSNGFYEIELARRVDLFGNIAQVFSSYESRHSLDDEKPFMRGINSFQLLNDGTRWWVMTIYWQQESAESPIPDKYLEKNK